MQQRGIIRRVLLPIAALGCALSGCVGDGGPGGVAVPARPGAAAGASVLLITVDTLRADRLGCYGYDEAATPRIDALADDGVRFDQVTTSAPVTLPAHATLLTGLLPPRHGVRHNGTFRLSANHRTFAERLQDVGYATGAFIGAYVLDSRYGLDQGFDRYDDDLGESAGRGDGSYVERPAGAVIDSTIAWLDSVRGPRPFFGWVHLYDPHGPYTPPEPWAETFRSRPYDGEVAYVDRQVGRLLDALRSSSRLDDTVVVFTSDHGEGLGEHGEATHADLIYDSTMRIPLLVRHPALVAGTVLDDRIAGAADLVPTLLRLLGVDHDPAEFDGRDVLTDTVDPLRAVYIETLAPLLDYGWAPLQGLRTKDSKFILAPAREYYDLAADPAETHNLFPAGEGTRRLAAELDRRLAAWPPALDALRAEATPSAEELRRLESLGYLDRSSTSGEIGTKDPKTMMGLWNRLNDAGRLSVQGEHAAAIETIVEVLEADPNASKGWYTATQIYDHAGRADDAEACVRRALELRPKAEGWVILARYALGKGDHTTFEHALSEAERLDPNEGGIFLGRGYALAQSGRLEEAREQFAVALRVDPVKSGADARRQIEAIDALLARKP